MRYRLSLLLFIFSINTAHAIPDFEADYAVSMKNLPVAQMHQSLVSNKDNTRTMTADSKAVGLAKMFAPDRVQEKSIWRVLENGFQPLSYQYDKTGGKKEKHITDSFDWDQNKVDITYKDRQYQLAIAENTYDKLSYQLALVNDLIAGKEALNYFIVDKYRIKKYTILRQGTETVTTPFGKFETVKLSRERVKSEDNKPERHTVLWCAPALNYLPIKLEHIEKDGTKFTALLEKLTGISEK